MTLAPVGRRVLIAGRVQGVGFREACRRAAQKADVRGWARNLADGRVEAWLEGEPDAVARVVAWCRHGPSWAHVTTVEVDDVATTDVEGFMIR